MVVLFNVQSHCDICPEVEKEFQTISASYKEETAKSTEIKVPVFFAIIYYEASTQRVFQRVTSANIL